MRERLKFEKFKKENKLEDQYSPEDLLFYYCQSIPSRVITELAELKTSGLDSQLGHIKYILLYHLVGIGYCNKNNLFQRYSNLYNIRKTERTKDDSVLLLAFAQGVLWANYIFNREELLEHSKGLQ